MRRLLVFPLLILPACGGGGSAEAETSPPPALEVTAESPAVIIAVHEALAALEPPPATEPTEPPPCRFQSWVWTLSPVPPTDPQAFLGYIEC